MGTTTPQEFLMKSRSLTLALAFAFGCSEAPQACEAFIQAPLGGEGCHVSVGECIDLDVATAVCVDGQCHCFKKAYQDIDLDEEVPDASFSQKRTCDLSSDEPAEHRDFELLFESECGYRLVKGGSS
jgi:hypothetical protein